MNKNIFKVALLSCLTLPAFVGCELDQYPDTSIPNEQSFKNVSDATNFNNNLYRRFRGICAQGWDQYDIMVDYYQPSASFGNRNGSYYKWEFTGSDFGGVWQSNYSAVSDCNNFLTRYQAVKLNTAADTTLMNQFLGETYFMRAFCYANMVLPYCQNYDSEKADKQLGLPLVTTVDINEKPARSSLKATYDFIWNDLKKADSLLTNTDLTNKKFTVYLLKALEARVALNQGEYQKALDAAKFVIESGKFHLATNIEEYAQMWVTDQGSEFIFVPFYNTKDERAIDWDGIFQNFNASTAAYSPDFIASSSTLAMYSDNDMRKDVFFHSYPVQIYKVKAPAIQLLNKYPGNPAYTLPSDSKQSRFNAAKPFRLAELYLTAAEAAYKLGQEAEAAKYLKTFTDARLLSQLSTNETAPTGKALFAQIKQEWKREFIGEGKYFFCLRRWKEGFTRNPKAQNAALISQENKATAIEATVTPDNMRWVFEIPTNDLTTNKNLVPNWK